VAGHDHSHRARDENSAGGPAGRNPLIALAMSAERAEQPAEAMKFHGWLLGTCGPVPLHFGYEPGDVVPRSGDEVQVDDRGRLVVVLDVHVR